MYKVKIAIAISNALDALDGFGSEDEALREQLEEALEELKKD